MDSNLHQKDHFFEVQQEQSTQEKQMGSGLVRYQSAPSSYLSTFLDKVLCEEFLNRPTSPETDRFFERLLANSENFSGQESVHLKQGSPVKEAEQLQNNNTGFVPVTYPSIPPQPRPPPPFSEQNSRSGMDYRVVASMGMERLPQLKVGTGAAGGGSCNRNSNSTLVRHSSSPAGFFSKINIGMENGYPVMRGMGDYGPGNRDTTYSAASRPPHPSSGRMSPIAENGGKNMGENSLENVGRFGESRRGNYVTGFSVGSWDDTSTIPPPGGKGFTDNDDRTFSGLNEVENQLKGGEAANAPRMLARHLSLQNTSAEMAALEKILQLQDSVPCKIRAKRGCATHPRSIAERVRRTRISERMRKLQDLVPNMDKQTNTADMLDLAVDYIKDLQRQVKILLENRANCTCTKIHQ